MFSPGCCGRLTILFFALALTACEAPAPTWRVKASSIVAELDRMQAHTMFPVEYHNLLETFEHGEAIIHVTKDQKEADSLYLFTLQKAGILKLAIQKEEQRKAAEERKRVAEEAARKAEELLLQQVRAAEERLQQQEKLQAEEETTEQKKTNHSVFSFSKDIPRTQPASYTVRRGETLPQIAARAEIYNDSTLWPLIYRANRDQIRDPKRLWPGQVLSIPRVTSSKK